MFFSVIIPTFNRAHLISDTIRSLLGQSFTDFEIIVVDDGSSDDTGSVIAAFKDDRIIYHRKKKEGVSAARNSGLKLSRGSYINFFDSDDIAYPYHLESAAAYFEKNPGCKFLAMDYEWGEENSEQKKPVRLNFPDPNKAILSSNYLSTNCVFLSAEVAKAQRFNEKLKISEDWDYWLRLSTGVKIHLGKRITSYLIDHGERSVRHLTAEELLEQKNILLDSLKTDEVFYTKHKNVLPRISAHMLSYISINEAVKKNKKNAIQYFFKSLMMDPTGIFERRSLAILKHLLLNW